MARLRYDQLDKALSKQIAPLYVVTGDETLLVQEACDKIRQAAKARGYLERELYHTDAGFQWDTLINSANSLSLFAEKKIIEIRIHNGKPGDAGSRTLIEYCKTISNENLLLLIFPKIDKRTQNTKWFKALDASGDIVSIWPVSLQQMPRWIEERLGAAGLHANQDAIEILCAKTEGNLLAAVQEIEKLKLIVTDKVIDASTMADAVTDSARYDVFSLTDKAIIGDSRAAVASLNGLRAEGTEATLVLWALSREIRTLASIKEGVENGKSLDFCAKQAGVWDNRKAMIKQAVNRLQLRQIHLLVRKSSNADKMIKGIIKGDVWNVLLDIVLSLTGNDALNARSTKLGLQSFRS